MPEPNRYKPTPRECVLLFLGLIEARQAGTGKATTRVRLAEITLKRLWNRERLAGSFLAEVGEWFLTAGWALIYAGTTYAAVKIDAVENWPRVSSKLLAKEIAEVRSGSFKFDLLDHLLGKEERESEREFHTLLDEWANSDGVGVFDASTSPPKE